MKFFSKVVSVCKPSAPELFSEIKGREDLKSILKRAIHASKPVNILLWGPPSAGKSIFLDAICRFYAARAVYQDASNTSGAGSITELVQRNPKYTCIDEIEEAGKDMQKALLNVMQNGHIKYTLKKKVIEEKLDTCVIGTCNNIDKLQPQFLDRMMVLKIPAYTEEEYIDVARFALAKDNVKGEIAEYIAHMVFTTTGKMNLRQCVRIGSMAKTKEDVDELLQSLEVVS